MEKHALESATDENIEEVVSARTGNTEVTIIIKTLNEEANIERATKSALDAIAELRGQVVVADSLSTDRTVEIASRYPVTVVQLSNGADRCCGAGPQLGFQYADGEFLYILDGDMEMDSEFLPQAVEFLRTHPDYAGVAGIVEELGGGNYEFETRKTQGASWSKPGEQRWLDMGGLYRRSAVEASGYFSNRNLHACEEQDLGLRLRNSGGRLMRLPIRSVRHYGHQESSWALMKRRLKTRYANGPGELARATAGTPMLWEVLKSNLNLVAMAGLWLVLLLGAVLLPWTRLPFAVAAGSLALVAVLMLIRKRDLSQTALALANWQLRTLGFVRGLFSRQVAPKTWLESAVIASPAPVATKPHAGARAPRA